MRTNQHNAAHERLRDRRFWNPRRVLAQKGQTTDTLATTPPATATTPTAGAG